jgi:prepilin-type N-terminal cleavage/methylation domain-containing protein
MRVPVLVQLTRKNFGRNRLASERGFTLIEVLVAVAIVAIVAGAITPLVLKYIGDARRARALSDARTIGQAILSFNLDTGRWPVSNDGTLGDAGELSRLVGLAEGDISAGNIPGGAGSATGDGNWDGGSDGGAAGAIEDYLKFNADGDTDPLYPVSSNPALSPGWNGPYLQSVPTDPWGNPYVINVRYLDGAGVGSVTTAMEQDHAVFVISAGANSVFETSFDDDTALSNDGLGGDDVGWMIEGRQTRD